MARRALTRVSLKPFGTKQARHFHDALDEETLKLKRRIRSWGLARKVLNIFLRGCLYNAYLREHYHLDRAEPWFEIPLDKIVAVRLQEACKRFDGANLPRWHTV